MSSPNLACHARFGCHRRRPAAPRPPLCVPSRHRLRRARRGSRRRLVAVGVAFRLARGLAAPEPPRALRLDRGARGERLVRAIEYALVLRHRRPRRRRGGGGRGGGRGGGCGLVRRRARRWRTCPLARAPRAPVYSDFKLICPSRLPSMCMVNRTVAASMCWACPISELMKDASRIVSGSPPFMHRSASRRRLALSRLKSGIQTISAEGRNAFPSSSPGFVR